MICFNNLLQNSQTLTMYIQSWINCLKTTTITTHKWRILSFKELIISLLIKEKTEIMGHSRCINYEFVFGFHLPTVRLVDEIQFIYLKVQSQVSALFKNAAISQNHYLQSQCLKNLIKVTPSNSLKVVQRGCLKHLNHLFSWWCPPKLIYPVTVIY